MKPRFIVIDGPEAAGKSSLAKIVAKALDAAHEAEPTESPAGKLIRSVLRGEQRIEDPRARQLLFAADRIEHTRVIREHLAAGRNVVCDRYVASGLTYGTADMAQVDTRDEQSILEMACWTHDINRWALIPDVTVILDVPFEVCAARLHARAARELYDDGGIQRFVHALYARVENLIPHHAVVHVDGTGEPDAVAARILTSLIGVEQPRGLARDSTRARIRDAVLDALAERTA